MFELEKLFNKVKVKSLKYKTSDLPESKEWIFDLPALTAWIQNQWLNNFVPRSEATILKNVISISANWANTWATFYQKNEFTVLQDSYAIEYFYTNDKLNDKHYLFLTSAISKTIFGNYEWTNKAGWERIKSQKIELPIKNWKIDFDFMESFIEELEKQRIEKLNNYLEVTWLKDYNLTSEEERVLEDFENEKIEFWEFKFNDNLFNLLKVSDKLSKSNIDIWWVTPIYSSESKNNWIIWYTNNKPEFIISDKNPIYLVFWDHTRSFNIAIENFCVADNTKVLSVNNEITIKILQYISSSWKKSIPNKGYARHWSIAQKIFFSLPIKDNEPDYELMETLISAIQKIVIKEVVDYVQK